MENVLQKSKREQEFLKREFLIGLIRESMESNIQNLTLAKPKPKPKPKTDVTPPPRWCDSLRPWVADTSANQSIYPRAPSNPRIHRHQ